MNKVTPIPSFGEAQASKGAEKVAGQWPLPDASPPAAPAKGGAPDPLRKPDMTTDPLLPPPALWRDGFMIKGYDGEPGPGPWYTAEQVRAAIAADRAFLGDKK